MTATLQDKLDEIIEAIVMRIVSTKNKVDNSEMEKRYFFYKGIPTIDGKSVFYLIATRIRADLVSQTSNLIFHIFKTIGEAMYDSHMIVVDMSFAGVSAKDRDMIMKVLELVALCVSTGYVISFVMGSCHSHCPDFPNFFSFLPIYIQPSAQLERHLHCPRWF